MKKEEDKIRVIILGLDGATMRLIKPWAKEGKLPNFKRLIENGSYGNLESTVPPVTPPAWTSITTGKNPGKHGIFDFNSIEFTKQGWKAKIYSSKDKKAREIWDYLGIKNKVSIIANIPLTYPPRKINGILISGMFTPDINANFTYPSEVKREILEKIPDYIIELSWSIYKDNKEKFLKDLYTMTERRIKLFWYLFNKKEWDLLFFVFIGPDRIQHLLWESNELLNYYIYLDKFLGDILKKIAEMQVSLFVISDHGFNKTKKEISINSLLQKEGYLKSRFNQKFNKIYKILNTLNLNKETLYTIINKYKLFKKIYKKLPEKILHILRKSIPGEFHPTYDFDLSNSRAIFVGTGGIYILEDNEYLKKELENEIIEKLENLKDPETGEKVIEKVFRKDEIYQGNLLAKAPDLLILPRSGYSLVHSVSDNILSKPRFKIADHDLYGIFFACGPGIKKGYKIENAKIYDIAPTILHVFGLPIPNDMDGRVLMEIFEDDSEFAKRKPKYVDLIYYEKKGEDEKLKKAIKNLKLKGKI